MNTMLANPFWVRNQYTLLRYHPPSRLNEFFFVWQLNFLSCRVNFGNENLVSRQLNFSFSCYQFRMSSTSSNTYVRPAPLVPTIQVVPPAPGNTPASESSSKLVGSGSVSLNPFLGSSEEAAFWPDRYVEDPCGLAGPSPSPIYMRCTGISNPDPAAFAPHNWRLPELPSVSPAVGAPVEAVRAAGVVPERVVPVAFAPVDHTNTTALKKTYGAARLNGDPEEPEIRPAARSRRCGPGWCCRYRWVRYGMTICMSAFVASILMTIALVVAAKVTANKRRAAASAAFDDYENDTDCVKQFWIRFDDHMGGDVVVKMTRYDGFEGPEAIFDSIRGPMCGWFGLRVESVGPEMILSVLGRPDFPVELGNVTSFPRFDRPGMVALFPDPEHRLKLGWLLEAAPILDNQVPCLALVESGLARLHDAAVTARDSGRMLSVVDCGEETNDDTA